MADLSAIEAIFFAAKEKSTPEQRAAYLDAVCTNDLELRRLVERLLAAQPQVGSFLAVPAVDAEGPTLPPLPQPAELVTEAVGQVIAHKYTLVQKLGEGGMGSVWVAEQSNPIKRRVALKMIRAGFGSHLVLRRFEAERQALALMDHPNIAKILDGGTADGESGPSGCGRPFFVMELVKGVPITRYCDELQLSIRERLKQFLAVCQAIQHAHQKGIIHRDIKPSNVLVTIQDGLPMPKVIDFGVAKALNQRLTERTLNTEIGAVVGTLEYMSPEQAELSALDIDTRADIYALGVLLYELLTGTTPLNRSQLKDAAIFEMLRIIKQEEPPKPSTRLTESKESLASLAAQRRTEPAKLKKEVRGELDWIAMKCLEKDRTRRYESASGLARDIERFLADEAVDAGPPGAAYRLRKFIRRNKGQVAAAGLVLLALIGGLIGAGFGLLEAGKQQLANSLRQQAERDRDAAEIARDGETRAKQETEAAREKLAVIEYGRTMELAHQLWRENDVTAALALLDGVRPDLRGWEWHYVHRLCHSDRLTINPHKGGAYSAAFSPDGLRIVTGNADGTARVWDAETGAELLVLKGHNSGVPSVSFSSDGSRIVTGSYDATAMVWDAKTKKQVITLRGHAGAVKAASFSPDGLRVVTGSTDRTAMVWDVKTGNPILTLKGHSGEVVSVSFNPDGSRVITGSGDHTAKVWDMKTGAETLTLIGHQGEVTSAQFSPDGSRVVTGSHDRTAMVWDAATGVELATLRGHTHVVLSASFSPDVSRIVTGSWDETAKVWDAKTGAELLTLRGHTQRVDSASFSADGWRVLTGSHDQTAKIWDATPVNREFLPQAAERLGSVK
jgi:WD40 repeat protein/serine/threonine protein kinase